jgi:hypothetical protein
MPEAFLLSQVCYRRIEPAGVNLQASMSALQRSPDSRHVRDMGSLIAAGEHTFSNNPALTIST